MLTLISNSFKNTILLKDEEKQQQFAYINRIIKDYQTMGRKVLCGSFAERMVVILQLVIKINISFDSLWKDN